MSEDIHPKMYRYKRIVDAKLYIDENFHEKIDLGIMSAQANFSKFHFARLFKKSFGKTPHQYLIDVRLAAAKKSLKQYKLVQKVCFDVGFESVPSFISLFKKKEKMTPNQYLKMLRQNEIDKANTPFSFIPGCFSQNFQKHN